MGPSPPGRPWARGRVALISALVSPWPHLPSVSVPVSSQVFFLHVSLFSSSLFIRRLVPLDQGRTLFQHDLFLTYISVTSGRPCFQVRSQSKVPGTGLGHIYSGDTRREGASPTECHGSPPTHLRSKRTEPRAGERRGRQGPNVVQFLECVYIRSPVTSWVSQ